MAGLSSDELAEDYKASLEDLSFNSRYEISNLTVIARENIHAAQAIARTLEQHIHSVGSNTLSGEDSRRLVVFGFIWITIPQYIMTKLP